MIWNVDDGKEIKTLTAHAGPVFGVAYPARQQNTGDGWRRQARQAVGHRKSGMEKAKLEGHGDAVWSVAVNKDGVASRHRRASIARSNSGTPRAKNREHLPVTRTG